MNNENVSEIDLFEIVARIKKNKKLVINITVVVTVVTVIVSLFLPKTYEAESVIQLGYVGGGIYTSAEAKNIILGSEILLPVKEKFFGDDISFQKFKEDHVETSLVLERVGLAENKEVSQVVISTKARTAEGSVLLNKEILDGFISYVNPLMDNLINIKEEELVTVDANIDRIKNNIAILSYEISVFKGSSREQDISRVLILRSTVASLENSLSEKQSQKYDIEELLARKRDFEVVSEPQIPYKPIFPRLWINTIVSFILGLLLSFLVVLSRSKDEI